MLKTIICDDEVPALELLGDMLRITNEVDLLGSYQSASEAITAINHGGVDLAFFDIEMPELAGVEAVAAIKVDPKPLVIFATAHPEYAVDAFGIDAIDFVLKPFDEDRIAKAVGKATRMVSLIRASGEVSDQMISEATHSDVEDVLKVQDGPSVYFVPFKDIIWIEAAGDYSVIHRLDRELAVRKTISSLESDLSGAGFCRIHRSHIVSIEHVSSVKRMAKGEAEIKMTNGVVVRSSRSYSHIVEALTA